MKVDNDFHITPKDIALAMARLLPPEAVRVLDPFAGSGVLIQAVRELDPEAGRFLYFYELQQDLADEIDYATCIGYNFDGEHTEDYFDAIIANPPYTQVEEKYWWIDQMTDALTEGGTIVMLLPNRLLTMDFENLKTVKRIDLGLVDFGTAKVSVFIYVGTKVKGTKQVIAPTVIPTKCTTQLGLIFEGVLLSSYGYTVNRVEVGNFLSKMEIGGERREGLIEYRVIFDEFRASEHALEDTNDSDGYCAFSVFWDYDKVPTIDELLYEGYRTFIMYRSVFRSYIQEPYEFISETPITEVNEFLPYYYDMEKDEPKLEHLRTISYRLYKDFKAMRLFTFKNVKVTEYVTHYIDNCINEFE